jgi:hypothetical protein
MYTITRMPLKRKKKIKDTMTSSQLSGNAPPDWGLYPELATIMDRTGTSAENAQKKDSLGDSPGPHWDPALSAKVTTGGLTAPVSRWKVGCHLLWIDGFRGPLCKLHFLASMLRSLE